MAPIRKSHKPRGSRQGMRVNILEQANSLTSGDGKMAHEQIRAEAAGRISVRQVRRVGRFKVLSDISNDMQPVLSRMAARVSSPPSKGLLADQGQEIRPEEALRHHHRTVREDGGRAGLEVCRLRRRSEARRAITARLPARRSLPHDGRCARVALQRLQPSVGVDK